MEWNTYRELVVSLQFLHVIDKQFDLLLESCYIAFRHSYSKLDI